MLGGHLDSWHTGTGATDNTAGVAVAMEAVRILKALGVRPRRTIRIGLWAGEEQGFLGSVAHVENHFAARPEPKDKKQAGFPRWMRQDQGPLNLKPAHSKVEPVGATRGQQQPYHDAEPEGHHLDDAAGRTPRYIRQPEAPRHPDPAA